MNKPKTATTSITEKQTVTGTYTLNGAELDTLTFNISLIARHDTELAGDIYQLAVRAGKLAQKKITIPLPF